MRPPAMHEVARWRGLLRLAGVALACGCGAHAPPGVSIPAGSDPARLRSVLAFDCQVVRIERGEINRVMVIGRARNRSDGPVRVCGRFDFEGRFAPLAPCEAERSPTLFILSRASVDREPLECRPTVLDAGAVFCDTLSLRVYRPDFARCPGSVEIRGAFWVGRRGASFAEATCLADRAFQVTVEVP